MARSPFRSRPLHVKAKTKRQIDRAQFRVGIEYFRGARAVVVVVVVLKSVRRRSRSQPHCQHWASFKPLLLETVRPHSLLPSAEAIEEMKYRGTNMKYKRGKKTRTVRTAAVTARY